MSVCSSIESVEGLVRNLSIAENSLLHGQEPSTRSRLGPLQTSIRMLMQASNDFTLHAQSVKSLANDGGSHEGMSIAEVCSLHGEIKKLEKVTGNIQTTLDTLDDVTHQVVSDELSSFAGRSGVVGKKILPYFEKEIKVIIRDVLNGNGNNVVNMILWKVAEECYNQATKPFGKLDAENYFSPLEEANLQWPYDPDFESEEYYEHENRLGVDAENAAVFRDQEQHRSDARQQDRETWPKFWIAVLNRVPNGPTLFCPPAGLCIESSNLEDVPRYLFRTFDTASSGKNNDSVVASVASFLIPHESRNDLLTTGKRTAALSLYQHLKKSCFEAKGDDNLMSWTSSLLFAIQYGIWRAATRRSSLSDVKVCAVDTRNFPKGQFAQDLCLLQAYRATAQCMDKEIEGFFRFRLTTEDFYNGEYLSQGQVNHAGRSCVTTLEALLNSGLRQIYPEFDDPRGGEKWAKRVRQLREKWSVEQPTTEQEIALAVGVARKCFAKFNSSEIASIVLTLKHRKHSRSDLKDQFIKNLPRWDQRPNEVRQQWIAIKALNSYDGKRYLRSNHLLFQHSQALRDIFS